MYIYAENACFLAIMIFNFVFVEECFNKDKNI